MSYYLEHAAACRLYYLCATLPKCRCRTQENIGLMPLFFNFFFFMLFFSFHLSGGQKQDFEFLKSLMGILMCILDVDTVVNKSKPEIPIINHIIVFTIKMSPGISAALLTTETFVLYFVLFTHCSNSTLWACYKLHLRAYKQRKREG